MSFVTAYISASLSNSGRIKELRDRLYTNLGAHTHEYEPVEPHLTIIPSFDVERSQLHRINKKTAELELPGTEVSVNGLGVWPHIRNPRVVLLDVEADVSRAREELLSVLDESGAKNIDLPTPTHITLFMRDKGYADPPVEFQQALQQHVVSNRDRWKTQIEHVDVPYNDC